MIAARGDWGAGMDDNVQYAAGQNVARFYDRFVEETDPAKRDLLLRIMLGEERRYGNAAEQLDLAERWLEQCSNHIERHRDLKEKYDGVGDGATWESVGRNLVEIRLTMIEWCNSLRENLERASRSF